MAAKKIKVDTLLSILALVLLTEWMAWQATIYFDWTPLVVIGLIRILQIAAISALLVLRDEGMASIGWALHQWHAGIKKGVMWSIVFGLIAGLIMMVMALMHHTPLRWIRSPMPGDTDELLLFFLVGGLIAPVAEELCFRGVLYTFFRRWGIALALITSTAIFVGLHSVHGIPIPQIVGGIVFAIAYETSGNLMVPITIHVTGNLAIFSLSLL